MKLTAIFLLAACLAVSAKGKGQNITLQKKNATLENIFQELRNQSGLPVLYTRSMLEKAGPVTVNLRDVSLQTALDVILKDFPLTYSIVNNTIVIKEKIVDKPKFQEVAEIPPPIDVKGRVVNENGEAVTGASIQIKGLSTRGTSTDANGFFELKGIDENAVLIISGVNIENMELKVAGKTDLATITIKTKVTEGEEVIMTGYTKVKPNEWIGSASRMNTEQVNRVVSPDILSRIQNIPGLQFKSGHNTLPENLVIRGTNTIFSRRDPLIVIDNFPIEGDMTSVADIVNSLNPNDVESINILRDAAATSIYGVKGANGVVVITTKRGTYNQRPKISLNTNFTVQPKPDLSRVQFLNSGDFIDLETWLFNKGFYNADISNPWEFLTPAVDILARRRSGLISADDSTSLLNELKGIDARDDLTQHFYKTNIFQQHSLSVSGGGSNNQYYVSFGFDHNSNTGFQSKRYTFNATNTWQFFKNRFEIISGVMYSQTNHRSFTDLSSEIYYPYAKLADANGDPLPIHKYKQSFIDSVGGGKLLDWSYYPLKEYSSTNNKTTGNFYRIELGLNYRIIPGLSIELKYQYGKQGSEVRSLRGLETYYTRDLINQYTNLTQSAVALRYPIPLGAILDFYNNNYTSHNGRTQLNFNRSWRSHHITAFIGTEIRDVVTRGDANRIYGYDESNGTTKSVDYINSYPTYWGFSSRISDYQSIRGTTSRAASFYGNFVYIFKNRYSFSASARKDGANVLGATTNNKWRPLWSAGLGWDLSKEKFYKIDWMKLKLRATYGYQGNIPSVPAVLTINYSNVTQYNFQSANVHNAPNPDLRWEKIGQLNLGLDFSIKDRISGTIEYYHKRGTDIIGQEALAPTMGYANAIFKNSADIKGTGVEFSLSTSNISNKNFSWQSSFSFSYNKDWVTMYKRPTLNIGSYIEGFGFNPIVGRSVNAVYSYRWAGLDPENGDPRGYLNNQVSKNYTGIRNLTDLGQMVYNGPSIAPYFGGLMNMLRWKNLSFSFYISYKWGHVFRRNSIDYQRLFNGQYLGHIDYINRWKVKGDEHFTDVPSMVYIDNPEYLNRNSFYRFSEALVEKGDHIRLQDMRLSYDLIRKLNSRLPFQSMKVYLFSSNIGILWKASKQKIDPEFFTGNAFSVSFPRRSISMGLKFDF